MSASIVSAATQPKICANIYDRLIQRQHGYEPKDFYIEFHEQNGVDVYEGLDIDGEQNNDRVIRGCGASIDSACSLSVNLSTGKQLELETVEGERFFLGRIKSSIYVITGETSKKKRRNEVKDEFIKLPNKQ